MDRSKKFPELFRITSQTLFKKISYICNSYVLRTTFSPIFDFGWPVPLIAASTERFGLFSCIHVHNLKCNVLDFTTIYFWQLQPQIYSLQNRGQTGPTFQVPDKLGQDLLYENCVKKGCGSTKRLINFTKKEVRFNPEKRWDSS